jgi:hypothetical protein
MRLAAAANLSRQSLDALGRTPGDALAAPAVRAALAG